MREKLHGFVEALRTAGVAPSIGESMDAFRAVLAAGIEREVMREALAATLVKDHADRPVFDDLFERHFGLGGNKRRKRTRPPTTSEEIGAGRGEGAGSGRTPRDAEGQGGAPDRREAEKSPEARTSRSAQRLARRRALEAKPFQELSPLEVEEARELLDELARRYRARRSRRFERERRGRLDLRRTFRRAMTRGGVPVELFFRRQRPGRSDLVALVDLSYSTALAAEFLLALLAPARGFFRRVRLLAYVDDVTEVSFENGHVVPHGAIDLNARSDFGRVLHRFGERWESALGRNTVLLILGDARNNRRPPRADLLARLRRQVRTLVWLNPEPRARWNTGDSTLAAYARSIDVLLAAGNLRELATALEEM